MQRIRLSRFSIHCVLGITLVALTVSGCKSKQDAAIEEAKKQAVSTGQPQQVVSTDKNGNTVTTVVQPPQPGQTGQVVTTTVTPKAGSGATGQAATTPVAPAPPPEIHVTAGT